MAKRANWSLDGQQSSGGGAASWICACTDKISIAKALTRSLSVMLSRPTALLRTGARWRVSLTASGRSTVRCASTVAGWQGGLSWPQGKQPTPYEVLGLVKTGVDARQLKKRYHELAKLYHPDTAGAAQQGLGEHERLRRFKLVNEAYALLSDASRRRMYDMYATGWAHGPAPMAPAMAHGAYHERYAYYNAGTWEDMQDLNSDRQQVQFSAWGMVVWALCMLAGFQVMAFLIRLEERTSKSAHTHEEAEHALLLAHLNYGLDQDRVSRVRRFLWFRSWGLYRTKAELDEAARTNEALVRQLEGGK
ncbi:ADL327Wp [Eremothecium gossypii ATCC 10895]|uniref:J domain-containing protein 1 n=1 Tax=Eremothecium gossypii (strain ATCC 10895 / CBS 109.51 / FGSC 9923 / NRRL Y-1056) TaxID=284811 RepID=JID1_EREGS|nr:ADL327Wp [Eremothecium gossypii ATCC 10895]Q75BG6.1 RecName: Full=J domain-containing protein 1 [Eremothecium gossypii ATCC 10895]AAS51593.1 ADL327Wp [Eremothecium gossypii ATCC 10895]